MSASVVQIIVESMSKHAMARVPMNGENVEIGNDPGTGRTIIGMNFLKTLEHKIAKQRGNVRGLNGEPLALDRWATFTFYQPGYDGKGNPVLMKFTNSGWVVDNLAPISC
ncbi:hypothetical protein QBC40DRAFT_249458 [Triangularia verruculosa]|uniref:Uncharacterized protein n=1 Tax=Triangularia verruculosa TaxID=2587418 RepID=A0AAN6XQN3_9PEZI|nr:hypothetical protein QBC40DRAFT_249458 [Triangularia verruculosa]